jgi:hypothetical protein
MQLAVIDDLITQQQNIIKQYPDNAPKAIAYLSGFIDCARKAQIISEREYQAFKAQVLEMMP